MNRIKTLSVPLKVHKDLRAFKLFLLDCGLLGAMSNTPAALLLLSLYGISAYYYSKENSRLELDFVTQLGSDIFPIEVKAEENLQSKSLKATLADNPNMRGLHFSMSDYREQGHITNVPLYGARAYLARKYKGYEAFTLEILQKHRP